MRFRGYVCIFLAALCWGGLGPVSRLAFHQGVTPLEVAFWRACLGWILFAAQAVMTRRTRIRSGDKKAVFFFGIWGVTVFYGSYQLAVQSGGAALAAVLLYTAPAWVALFSRMFLAEVMTPGKIVGIIMTTTGVVAVALGGRDAAELTINSRGIAFGLLAGLTYAMYYIFGKKMLTRYASATLFMYALPVGALGLLPFVDFSPMTPTAWVALLILAVVSTWGAYSLYYCGLKHVEASRAAVVATLEPIVAAFMAYFWWDEQFTPVGYLGAVVIILAVIYLVFDKGQETDDRQTPATPVKRI